MDPLKTKLKVEHWHEFVPMEKLVELQKKAYRIFYFRPSVIWRQLKQIRSFYEIKVKIRGAISVLGINFGETFKFKTDNQVQIK